ncbi:MAG: phosphatase PAP2 family protein [Candidatus Saccharimonadales bacterium]
MASMISIISIFSDATWRRLFIAFICVTGPIFLFINLADEVRDNDTLVFDEMILRTVNGFETPLLDAVTVGLTQLGGVVGVTVLTVGLATLLYTRKMRQRAAILVTGVGGAAFLNILLKTVFQRDRPELWERIVTENSFSFPSGHAMASSALALSIIVIFWPTRWRWIAVIGSLVYVIIIAFTRLYLGVHYPTDIVAGWMVSAAWIGSIVVAVNYRKWKSLLHVKK